MPRKPKKEQKKSTGKSIESGSGKKKGTALGKRSDKPPQKVQPHPLEQKFADLGIEGEFLNRLPSSLVTSMPPEVLKAFQDAFRTGNEQALVRALETMSPEDRLDMLTLVEATAREMGVDPDHLEEEEQRLLLEEHGEFLRMIAELAFGDPPVELRVQVEEALEKLELEGWHLLRPVRRIWEGERDLKSLTEGVDHDEAVLIGGVLDRIEKLDIFRRRRAELVESMPVSLQKAFHSGDPDAVERELQKLPSPEQKRFNESMDELLIEAGIETEEALDADDEDLLDSFDDLLEEIMDIVNGTAGEASRTEVENELNDLEANGWQLLDPVRRIWDGERNLESLAAGLPREETVILETLLARLDEGDEKA